jgi:hypothetical protein
LGELCLMWPELKLHQLLVDSVIGFLNWGRILKIFYFRKQILKTYHGSNFFIEIYSCCQQQVTGV